MVENRGESSLNNIEGELYIKFLNFIKNLPYNNSYDCSEVAGDFNALAEGIIYNVINAENKFGGIYVLQNGIVVPYTYHHFYTYKNYVYDPFICTSLIKFREYVKVLTDFNLMYNVRISIEKL